MISSNISQFYFGNDNDISIREQNMDQISDLNVINDLKSAANEPNGKPLLIYQHATISNTFFPSSLPTNVSFTLLEGWTSKNVTINYDRVSHQNDWVVNGTFDSGESPWEYFTNNADFIKKSWDSYEGEDCVGIEISKGQSFLKGDYSYFEENFTIPEPSASNTFAQLSMDYHFIHDLGTSSNNISLFISIDIGGEKKNTTSKLINLVKDYWTEMSVSYDLTNYNQQILGNNDNITVRVGVITENNTISPASKLQLLYLDNIQFTVWTEPSVSNLIVAKDLDDNEEYGYQNTTFGKGKTFIDVERSKNGNSDIKFTISKNDTFPEELNVYNITITSEAVKIFNSTIDLQDGSLYTSNTNINWQTEGFITVLPYTYLNNWAEINKPSDWNITSVLDGYGAEKRASCTGKEFGSENLIIPKGIFTSGLWTIKAVSQNYISDRNIGVWNGSKFVSQSSLTYNDKFQVNITLNDTISFQNTQINCTIKYPNGTTFWDGNQEPQSENVKFGNFTVGSNMSIGDYQVMVEWTNNNSYLTRDQVGFAEFGFKVWHHTNLTAVDPDFEQVAGDPLLVKVKFLDDDINEPVHFASVKYNSTFGASGVMGYLGSGVYFIDIDTSSLGLGDYYFSFNSTLEFYENQTANNLIRLTIISQALALEVPSSAINAMANSYAICQVNVTGAVSGELIPGDANMTTDWANPYQVTNDTFGTFTLNFSTIDIPTQGVFESFTITVFANKTDYGTTTGFITLIVNPIQTVADANKSVVNAYLNDIIDIKVNYTIDGSSELISGANCSVEWQGASNIVSVADGFIISLDTNGLSISYYTALITLEHVGYANAFKSITIIINSIQTVADANESIVNAYLNEVIDIKVNYTIADTNELISGAICSVDWQGASNIVSIADGFILSLDTNGLLSNSRYAAIITLEHVGYANAFESITIIISEQSVNLKVVINSFEVGENSLIETSYNEVITLSCRAYAALEQIYLSGGTITFITEQFEQSLVKYDNSWFNTSIPISTSTFSLGINYVYIEFQQDNYTTTTFSFQILVSQIEFDVQTIDFQDSIEVDPGENIQIRINLTEFGTNNFIENATISYLWDFGLGNFEEIGDGIYELELVIPDNIRGSFKVSLIISTENDLYKATQSSFLLVINEPEASVLIILIILIISAAIISALGMLSLRAYVFLPKKKKKDFELQQKIQLFKDVWNIQAFLVIHKNSGLPIYNKNMTIFKNQNETIISGFIQAISIFSESLVDEDTILTKKIDAQDKYLKNVFELDFKYFYLLVCEYEAIRTILIIKERSSTRLRKQLYLLAVAIYAQYPEKLENFAGLLIDVKDGIDVLLNKFLFLYYSQPFSITSNETYFSKIKGLGDLTKMETRIINVILSEFRSEKLFRLNTLVGLVEEENKDLVLEGIRLLIKRKILVSPYLDKFSPTIKKNFK